MLVLLSYADRFVKPVLPSTDGSVPVNVEDLLAHLYFLVLIRRLSRQWGFCAPNSCYARRSDDIKKSLSN
jgi:hypothetical protein